MSSLDACPSASRRKKNRHHHAFLLEDDVEVSPHFYAWAKWATLTYQYGRPSDFLANMYGVSLYTPRCVQVKCCAYRIMFARMRAAPPPIACGVCDPGAKRTRVRGSSLQRYLVLLCLSAETSRRLESCKLASRGLL